MRIQLKATREDFINSRLIFELYKIKKDKIFFYLSLIFATILIVFILEKSGIFSTDMQMMVFVVGGSWVGAVLYYFQRFIKVWREAKKNVSNFIDRKTILDFTKEGIYLSNKKQESHLFHWKDFETFIEFKNTIFIVPSYENGMDFIISKNQVSKESYNQLKNYLEQYIIRKNKSLKTSAE